MKDGERPRQAGWQTIGRLGGVRRQEVYRTLRLHALCYRFRPGQHLAVVDLSEQLRVSNTPVREALIRLHAEGLIAAVPSRGFFARELQVREMLEFHDLARILLTYCGRIASSLPPQANAASFDPLSLPDGERDARSAALLARRTEVIFIDLAQKSGNEAIRRAVADICERTHHIRVWAFSADQCAVHLRSGLIDLGKGVETMDSNRIVTALEGHFDILRAVLPDLVMRALAASFSTEIELSMRRNQELTLDQCT
jgi:DNA-binding GntR family transcriptional regulator